MVLFRVTLHLDPAQRTQVLQSLARIIGPTQALPGFVSCHVSCDVEEANAVYFTEEWQTWEHLEARLRKDSLRVVMAAMDCSIHEPHIQFDALSHSKGMEYIKECRSGKARVSGWNTL